MDDALRTAEHSGDAFRHAMQLQRAGRLPECADTLERAWLEGDPSCGDVLFRFLDEWRPNHAVAVATRLDRLACGGNVRARRTWEKWFPELTKILGVSANMQGLRRTILDQAGKPLNSILILKGGSGVGKKVAARVFHELSKGSEFVTWDQFSQRVVMPPTPENGTFFVQATGPGAWEAPCVEGCRGRRARLVVSHHEASDPSWHDLHKSDHSGYYVTPLDSRLEDLPDLIGKRFPQWLSGLEPWTEHVQRINVEPEAIVELSRRVRPLNARTLFFALHGVAQRAFRASDPETLTIGVEHLRVGLAE
jgi:hypothetical protein